MHKTNGLRVLLDGNIALFVLDLSDNQGVTHVSVQNHINSLFLNLNYELTRPNDTCARYLSRSKFALTKEKKNTACKNN